MRKSKNFRNKNFSFFRKCSIWSLFFCFNIFTDGYEGEVTPFELAVPSKFQFLPSHIAIFEQCMLPLQVVNAPPTYLQKWEKYEIERFVIFFFLVFTIQMFRSLRGLQLCRRHHWLMSSCQENSKMFHSKVRFQMHLYNPQYWMNLRHKALTFLLFCRPF